jgi:SNF2 family DNA or RNA helicase
VGPPGEQVEGLPSGFAALVTQLRAGPPPDEARSLLVDRAVSVWSRPGFDTLLCTPSLGFAPFDYQLATARTVLRRMRGRAILADEVGLGKTIEAGLVLSELRSRGLGDRALVICPTGLVEQWQEELERKFGLPTAIARGGAGAEIADGAQSPVVLASLAAARRDPLLSALTGQPWDVVVADEAHRLRSSTTASGKLARALRSRYLLLLTATPVENKLTDLYELVSLVAPGLLGTRAQFRRSHATGDTGVTQARNVAELRERTGQVMVRHRRSEVAVRLPHRLAETVPLPPSAPEARFYAELSRRIRSDGRDGTAVRRLTLRGLLRLAGSTPAATVATLRKLGWDDLADAAASIEESSKVDALLERLRAHVAAGEKVLVFTGFRGTLQVLDDATRRAGLRAIVYHGSLPRAEKEAAVAAFRESADILLSTESAGEGRNLQFCHVMVNVDLPWNPMQIEQRVGRLHRIGQQHDVLLTNLVSMGTVEQQVMHVLESKISLFELVVGELDMILGRVGDGFDFESTVFDAFVNATDDAAFERALAGLGDRIAQARVDYIATRGAVDALVQSLDEGAA